VEEKKEEKEKKEKEKKNEEVKKEENKKKKNKALQTETQTVRHRCLTSPTSACVGTLQYRNGHDVQTIQLPCRVSSCCVFRTVHLM
jgi:hypothetical protein